MSLFEIKNILLHVKFNTTIINSFITTTSNFKNIYTVSRNFRTSYSFKIRHHFNFAKFKFLCFYRTKSTLKWPHAFISFISVPCLCSSFTFNFCKILKTTFWFSNDTLCFSLHYIVFFVHGSSLFDEVLYTGIACSWHFDLY